MNPTNLELGDIRDWSSLVLVRVRRITPYHNDDGEERMRSTLSGYVFVIDRKFGSRAQWKLPAGHKQDGESPLDTAVRELVGETNLAPKVADFHYFGKWLGRRGDHWKILFCADVEERELGWMNNQHEENEGEEPKFFTTEQLYELVNQGEFMPEHYEKLVEFSAILPLGRDKNTAVA